MEIMCKGCGKNLKDLEIKEVGTWKFCNSCFDNFMNAQQEPPKQEAKQEPQTPVQQAKLSCSLCGDEIIEDNFKELGNSKMCPNCFKELTTFSKLPEKKEEEPEEKAEPIKVEIFPGAASNMLCTGCGKRLTQRGHYTVDEKPHCPDCFYKIKEEIEKKKMNTLTTPKETENKCQTCERLLTQDLLETVEGYLICQACLKSGREVAVNIAHAKHKKHLEELQKKFL